MPETWYGHEQIMTEKYSKSCSLSTPAFLIAFEVYDTHAGLGDLKAIISYNSWYSHPSDTPQTWNNTDDTEIYTYMTSHHKYKYP